MAGRWSPVLAMEAYLHALQLCGELQEAASAATATPARDGGGGSATATLAAEPRGAEYVAALAAGGQARLLVDVATGASASPSSLATTAALAVAAARTGGRLVCVRRDARGLDGARRHIERLGLAGSSVSFQLGRPAEAVRQLGRVDFAVVDGEMEDRDEVLEALDVDPGGAVVVVTNVFHGHEGTCHGRQLVGKSVVLPIGSGMEVVKIGRAGGQGGAHMQRPVRCSRNAKRTFLVCE